MRSSYVPPPVMIALICRHFLLLLFVRSFSIGPRSDQEQEQGQEQEQE